MVSVLIPTLNDDVTDFHRLFKIRAVVERLRSPVRFDFSRCSFLKQNAVAFLGGLARLKEFRGEDCEFLWDTCNRKVFRNLQLNGFVGEFTNDNRRFQPGNAIPYRWDFGPDVPGVMGHIENYWFGKGKVDGTVNLRNSLSGKVWELYENAFSHAESETGVFSCGQRYPTQKLLKFTIIDFGVGIPGRVFRYWREINEFDDSWGLPRTFPTDENSPKALQWAFQSGNSTKQSVASGLGLSILTSFVRTNGGRLDIYSNEALATIDSKGEQYSRLTIPFNGTAVNITIVCDERRYKLPGEVT